jgi:hypothetical protein
LFGAANKLMYKGGLAHPSLAYDKTDLTQSGVCSLKESLQ